jgi:hypothetical protein
MFRGTGLFEGAHMAVLALFTFIYLYLPLFTFIGSDWALFLPAIPHSASCWLPNRMPHLPRAAVIRLWTL